MDDTSGLTTSPCHFSFGIEVVPVVRGHQQRRIGGSAATP